MLKRSNAVLLTKTTPDVSELAKQILKICQDILDIVAELRDAALDGEDTMEGSESENSCEE